MKVLRIFPVFFFIGIMGLSAQEKEIISWHPERRLKWTDFKGAPLKTQWAAATTASGISYSFDGVEENGKIVLAIDINAYFYPDKSWYRPERCDANVLAHEQLHFDITELFARKMREKVAVAEFTHNVKNEMKAIYKSILRELNDFQNKYDHQTDFSRNPEAQKEWEFKVKEALQASN